MSSIEVANLFAVRGLVAVITGGGTGGFFRDLNISFIWSDVRPQALVS